MISVESIVVIIGIAEKNNDTYDGARNGDVQELQKAPDIQEMYKGINEFKKGYQPRACIKRKNVGRVVANTTSILSRWEQFYSHLLNVNQSTNLNVSEIYTVEPDIPEPCVVEAEFAIDNLKKKTEGSRIRSCPI